MLKLSKKKNICLKGDRKMIYRVCLKFEDMLLSLGYNNHIKAAKKIKKRAAIVVIGAKYCDTYS